MRLIGRAGASLWFAERKKSQRQKKRQERDRKRDGHGTTDLRSPRTACSASLGLRGAGGKPGMNDHDIEPLDTAKGVAGHLGLPATGFQYLSVASPQRRGQRREEKSGVISGAQRPRPSSLFQDGLPL